MSCKIIRLPTVQDIIGLSKPTIYRMMKRGEFPAQIKMGPKASGWLMSEVQDWVSSRQAARRIAGQSGENVPE